VSREPPPIRTFLRPSGRGVVEIASPHRDARDITASKAGATQSLTETLQRVQHTIKHGRRGTPVTLTAAAGRY